MGRGGGEGPCFMFKLVFCGPGGPLAAEGREYSSPADPTRFVGPRELLLQEMPGWCWMWVIELVDLVFENDTNVFTVNAFL